MTEAIDRFLALSLHCVMSGTPVPPWPDAWPQTEDFAQRIFARVAFHGVALALLRDPARLSDWPAGVRDKLREEARGQSFWEMGHREVLTRLVAALDDAGGTGILTKGSALAYSVYPEPALRRRGDSDVLIADIPRAAVRSSLAAMGFEPTGDARPLQESWASPCTMGFTHVFDLHWRINASAVLARQLEGAGIGTRSVPLPRLCPAARAIAPADNLILVAINRASHETFGYRSGDVKLFEQDRLIWALDFDLLCRSFDRADWDSLIAVAAASGAAPLVHSALGFAEAALGTVIPADVHESLTALPGDPRLIGYFGTLSGVDRLKRDLSASPALRDKLRLARYVLFPGPEVLHERFPDATHWPLAALRAWRLASGLGKLMGRRV